MDRSAGLSSRRKSSTGSDVEIPFCASFWNYCFRNYQGMDEIDAEIKAVRKKRAR
jgi:hypothetical protein